MSFDVNLYGLSDLSKDMRRHNQDIDEFCFSYNSIRFHTILDIGTVPCNTVAGYLFINGLFYKRRRL